jgi:Tfp pilus assembly PilM family ATPase
MLGFSKKRIYPVGVDLGSGYLRMAQLGTNGQGPFLVSAGLRAKPESIAPRSPAWQHWAIDAIKEIWHEAGFKGKDIVTALPSDDLFIDPIKMPRATLDRLSETALPKVQKRLPFAAENAIIQYCIIEQPETKGPDVDVLVIAAERETVNRYLAIYEKTGLTVAGISIWPTALIQSYSGFFCRRQNEQDRIAILLDVGTNHTNVVICRGSSMLFARVISIGHNQLNDPRMGQRLLAEIDACIRYFESLPGSGAIERMVFLAGSGTSAALCEKIAELAQQMQIAAQIGDVLCAVEMNHGPACLVDRRNSRIDWAMAFGLSLSGKQ